MGLKENQSHHGGHMQQCTWIKLTYIGGAFSEVIPRELRKKTRRD